MARYPTASGKWQVSRDGAVEANWNPDGTELFYRIGNRMMVVDVRSSNGRPNLGVPELLFERSELSLPFDVSPDGRRFVMIDQSETPEAPSQLNIVINWSEELKRLVRTDD